MWHTSTGAHDVVNPDPQASVAAIDHRSHQRVKERYGLGQVWSELVERKRALLERFEDQGKIELLEVAQAAVKQLAGSARGAGREIASFDEPDAQSTGDGIERAATASDTGADHKHVEILIC